MQISNSKFQILSIIRGLFYSLFFLTPLVISSHTSEIFEFNKMMLIYFISITVLLLWLVYYIVQKPILYFPKKLSIPIVVFFTALVLSFIFSIDRHTSLFGYYGRWNGGLMSIISYIVLLFVFLQVFSKQYVISLIKISLLASFIVLVWGFFAKFGYDMSCYIFTGDISNSCWTDQFQPSIRMFSTIGQPNWLGAYLVIHFFLGLYFFIEKVAEKSILRQLLFLIYLSLNILGIYFTGSKTAIIALVSSLAIVVGIVIYFKIGKKSKIIPKIVFGLISTALIVFIYYIAVGVPILDKINLDSASPGGVTDSFEIRKIVWQGGRELGRANPFFGTGPETFAYAYYFVKPQIHNLTSEWDFIYNKAHNEFINYLATTGYIGFISYLGVIASVFYIFYDVASHRKSESLFILALTGAFISIQITNFTGFSVSGIQIFFYLMPAFALVLGQKSDGALVISEIFSANKFKKIGIFILASGYIYSVIYLSQYILADRLYKASKDQSSQDQYQEASSSLTKAMRYRYEHVYEDSLSSTLAYLAFITSYEDENKLTGELIDLSKKSNTHTLQVAYRNINYYKTKAKNGFLYYQSTHDIQELVQAVETMEYVNNIAGNDPNSYYLAGLFYSLLAQDTGNNEYKEKAIKSVRYALNLRPSYIEAHELLQEIENGE